MKKTLLIGGMALLLWLPGLGQAASLIFLKGEANIASPQGDERAANAGAMLAAGEVLHTGRGVAQIESDGTLISLQPDSSIRFNDGNVELLSGNLWVVTGSTTKTLTPIGTVEMTAGVFAMSYCRSECASAPGLTVHAGEGSAAFVSAEGRQLIGRGERLSVPIDTWGAAAPDDDAANTLLRPEFPAGNALLARQNEIIAKVPPFDLGTILLSLPGLLGQIDKTLGSLLPFMK